MPNIDKLMLRKEYFPVVSLWVVTIPPYHPSMRQTGIDRGLVASLLEEAVRETVSDLEGFTWERPDIGNTLRRLARDPSTGKVLYTGKVDRTRIYGENIVFESVPLIDSLYIEQYGISGSPSGENSIAIDPGFGLHAFTVPETVTFPPELKKEYEMGEERVGLGRKTIHCPNMWHEFSSGDVHRVFYRNLVRLLDNAVVRKKYS